jgi:hypothetical protein
MAQSEIVTTRWERGVELYSYEELGIDPPPYTNNARVAVARRTSYR